MRNDDDNYRKLMLNLTRKAAAMGASDAEGAAHEALTRALKHPLSRPSLMAELEPQTPAADRAALFSHPDLLAWLHVVLFNVVSEERSRASYRRERFAYDASAFEVADPSPSQLDALLSHESNQNLATAVRDCVGTLSEDWQRVLRLRAQGLKQSEIAQRLGVPRATVATWTRRALLRLTELIHAHTNSPDPPGRPS